MTVRALAGKCRSFLVCLAMLFAFLGLPCLAHADRVRNLFEIDDADAVSSASLLIPDRPSGAFIVLLNRTKHSADTLLKWEDFFSGQDASIIFEDLHCLVIDADQTGRQMAERFQARLAEHQMTIRAENALFAVSRAQAGAFDVLIVSKEAADAVHLETVRGEAFADFIELYGSAEENT